MFLKDGMEFKNYSRLCEFMGWEKTRGNYMKARLKELDSICKWYREGNKIIIEMVYNSRMVKEDGRSKKSTYINPVETILLFALRDKEKPEVYFSNSKMYKVLGMFNDKFEEINYGDTNIIVEELMVSYLTAKSFKVNSKAEANRIIKRALSSMRDRRVIDYIDGRIIVGLDDKHRIATTEETKILLKIEKDILEEMGCYNYSQVEYKNLGFRYAKLFREKIKEHNIEDFQYCYFGYCVVSHNTIIANEINRQCKDQNFKLLNNLFVRKMKAIAISKYNKALRKSKEEINFGEVLGTGEASEEFVGEFNKMIDNYIEIK